MDSKAFDRIATQTLQRVQRVIDDEVDPDEVEAMPSAGVVTLDFQGKRRNWVLNSQSAAQQIWLAAEERAWHFAPEGEGEAPRWVAPKTGEELFATLERLFVEAAGIELSF